MSKEKEAYKLKPKCLNKVKKSILPLQFNQFYSILHEVHIKLK